MRMVNIDSDRERQEQRDRAELVAEGLLTVREAAEFLRFSRSRLYELMDAGELAYVKIGRSRRVPRRGVVELASRSLEGGHRGQLR